MTTWEPGSHQESGQNLHCLSHMSGVNTALEFLSKELNHVLPSPNLLVRRWDTWTQAYNSGTQKWSQKQDFLLNKWAGWELSCWRFFNTSCCRMVLTWSESGKCLDFIARIRVGLPAVLGSQDTLPASCKFPMGLNLSEKVDWLLVSASREKQKWVTSSCLGG